MKNPYDDLIEAEIKNGQIAGANLCVFKDDQMIYEHSYGYKNMETKTPMSKDTIFRLYSMTKPITAVAIMILVERGLIDLFEPVSKYLPGFRNQMVRYEGGLRKVSTEVTINQLMNMTSGVVYPGEDEAGMAVGKVFEKAIEGHLKKDEMTTMALCNAIGECPLAFEPGSSWRYGASADILGGVIEVVTHKKFSEFLEDEVFLPLGMKDTGFHVPKVDRHRFAQNYRYINDQEGLVPYEGDNLAIFDYRDAPSFESGGAGLVSTIEDYLRFTRMLLGNGTLGSVRILGRKTVDYLRTNQLTKEQKKFMDWEFLKGYGYGSCMRIMEDVGQSGQNTSPGEYGWDGWTGNYFSIDPKEQLIFLYFIQKIDTGTTLAVRKLKSTIYGSI